MGFAFAQSVTLSHCNVHLPCASYRVLPRFLQELGVVWGSIPCESTQ